MQQLAGLVLLVTTRHKHDTDLLACLAYLRLRLCVCVGRSMRVPPFPILVEASAAKLIEEVGKLK